jgi:hypothetical protein
MKFLSALVSEDNILSKFSLYKFQSRFLYLEENELWKMKEVSEIIARAVEMYGTLIGNKPLLDSR